MDEDALNRQRQESLRRMLDLRARLQERPAKPVDSGDEVEGARDDLDAMDRRQDIELKRLYAKRLLAGLAAQVAVVNVVFALYAWLGHDFAVPTEAMIAYLSATVIEVIGVVAIVTRYLFPNRDSGGS